MQGLGGGEGGGSGRPLVPARGGRRVGLLGSSDSACEVDRSGPRRGQHPRRVGDVEAAGGGERDPVGARDAQERCAPDRQCPDRLDQGGSVGAGQLGLLAGQPCLVEQHQHGPLRRLLPSEGGNRVRYVRGTSCALISHPFSLPCGHPTKEGVDRDGGRSVPDAPVGPWLTTGRRDRAGTVKERR